MYDYWETLNTEEQEQAKKIAFEHACALGLPVGFAFYGLLDGLSMDWRRERAEEILDRLGLDINA